MFEWIATFWCKRAHGRPMWPIHGRYICAQCMRQHPVAWDIAAAGPPTGPGHAIRLAEPRRARAMGSGRLIFIRNPEMRSNNCVTFPGKG